MSTFFRKMRRHGCGLGLAMAAAVAVPAVFAEIKIERVFMPHGAAPSSFAIGLPGGVSFCYDPLRAAVSYVWRGGFVDVTPARPGIGKFTDPVTLLGSMVYRETGAAPLRRGDLSRVPVVEFRGYALHSDTVEFRYTVDGTPVRETIALRADGGALVRRLQIGDGRMPPWWHVAEGRPPLRLEPDAQGALVHEIALGGESR